MSQTASQQSSILLTDQDEENRSRHDQVSCNIVIIHQVFYPSMSLGQTRFFFSSFLLLLLSLSFSPPVYYMGHVTSIARGLVIALDVSIQLPRNLFDDLQSWVEQKNKIYTHKYGVCVYNKESQFPRSNTVQQIPHCCKYDH